MSDAVLLAALGTPVAPTAAAVSPFLREFLSDKRVIDYPGWFWKPLLNGIIVPVRAPKTAAKYGSVWMAEGSPLAVYTQRQRAGLERRLPGVQVATAYRYGQPDISQQVAKLRGLGAKRVLVLTQNPQYSYSTVASVLDVLQAAPKPARHADDPVGPLADGVHVVQSFESDPGYIAAMAARVEGYWAEHGRPDFAAGEKLLLSWHSIPADFHERGDPYRGQCETTAALLRARLGLAQDEAPLTFQSRFGPAKWLTPATIDTVAALGKAGVTRVDVFCPGFTADCLETLEEIDILNRASFHAGEVLKTAHHGEGAPGGGVFHHIPCLNDSPAWLDALANTCKTAFENWED